MAESNETRNVARLDASGISQDKSKGYWADAWTRLIRNRLAVVGLIIIGLNIFAAIFAPIISPYDFATQNRSISDCAPMWVMNVFPTLQPRDESYRIRGGEAMVVTGQMVNEGDLLIDNEDPEDIVHSPITGMAFVDGSRVEVTPRRVATVEVPEGWELEVFEEQVIRVTQVDRSVNLDIPESLELEPEQVIARDPESNDVILAPAAGTVYLLDNTVYIRPMNPGYVGTCNEHPLGTDQLGRDIWTRILYGARVSLMVAFVGPFVSFLVGIPYGLVSGYFGGRVDNIMMRIVDLLYAFPTLLFIILLMAFFRANVSADLQTGSFMWTMTQLDRASGGMFFIFVGVGLTSWMGLARLTRGQVLSVREQEYIVAARSLGASTTSIMRKHVVPNILGPIIISETLTIPTYIRYEAFLSFIGLGVNPPTPSWGNMISDGASTLRSYPHEAIFPAIALFLIMFAFNFLGDGLRDALDPRMRGAD